MSEPGVHSALAALKRFTAQAPRDERCDLCGAPLTEQHDHLLDPEQRRLVCACRGCSLLFPNAAAGRYRRLQTRAQRLPDFQLSDADWRALEIPVRLVFLTPSRVHARVFATYPNAGGATEASVPIEAWNALVLAQPALAQIEPDVEALLIDQRPGRSRSSIVSVDVCYRIIGLLRARRGQAGAREVEDALARLDEACHA